MNHDTGITDAREKGQLCAMTVREVGKLLGISSVRVSQIEQAALRKLRRDPALRQFFEERT